MIATLAAALVISVPSSGKSVPSIIHTVIDDLGYHDPNWRNGQVETPNLDAMVASGVEIKEFYVYKMCAPSRASVLSGRYPYHVGYYNNNGGANSGVDLRFKLLPELLKPAGWATHALGKWHIGWAFRNYTPTWRGFDTFLGTSGNTGDYWYHLTEDASSCPDYKGVVTDIVDAKEPRGKVPPATGPGINGTYDARLLTTRAVEIVSNTPADTPLYIYLAFHNVHVPMHAPLETVHRFPKVTHDARKVTDAMLLEADWGVGNVSAALDKAGRADGSLFIVHTDNGGPGSHACNWPHRGGKFTFWEGGVRGLAFVSGGLLPAKVRGTQFSGLAHLADWYLTVAEGIAGVTVAKGSSGPIEPDSHNIWSALTTGAASPRTEVVHLPTSNVYTNTTYCPKGPGHGCAPSMRSGKYKIIYTWPGEDSLITLTPLSHKDIPYGKTGGIIRNGDQALGPHWNGYNQTHQKATCTPGPCLFDVSTDLAEEHDLSGNPEMKATIAAMTTRLNEEAATGAPLSYVVDKTWWKRLYVPMVCKNLEKTGGYWLPPDWDGTDLPPAPAPAPPPPPGGCPVEMRNECPSSKYSDPKSCRECCHTHKASGNLPDCKPKDFNAYCNNTLSE